MQILEKASLKDLNTFGIDVNAKSLLKFNSTSELINGLENVDRHHILPLGGGSNVLFMNDLEHTVLLNQVKGIELKDQNQKHVYITVGAGVEWHALVLHTIDKGWAGIENLSLIPGSVGAAPMQNIGAYGTEIKSVFYELEAVEISTGNIRIFTNKECEFGYRESIFKKSLRGKYIITSVTFKLNKHPEFNTSYGAVNSELERMGVTSPTLKTVSDAVINIRKSKLPDPKKIGNAGSFFKNPVVPSDLAQSIEKQHPHISKYPVSKTEVKLAAGWLIDQAGWKGKTFGNYGVHPNQALVLVNYGGASGKNIFDLSTEIMADVKEKFGVSLEREVNVIS